MGCLCALGRYRKVIESFKQALRLKPDDAKTNAGLGLSYLKLGDKDSALEEYKILKDLNTELADEFFNFI